MFLISVLLFFFFKQKTAYEIMPSLVGSEMCIRDSSGGQQQRVAIARALVVRPSLLLLDEPLSNLDAKLRVEMRGEIKRFHEELGLTSVYVTHDQSEALSLSDRIVLLNNGITQQVGSPKQLFNEPANLFVADFMGFKNFFPCLLYTSDAADDLLCVD